MAPPSVGLPVAQHSASAGLHNPLPSGLPPHIPPPAPPPPPPSRLSAECCCGRRDCAFVRRSNALLRGLQKDLQAAARIGQALLARHEAFVADAQQEKERMNGTIEQLEGEKHVLLIQNAMTVEENRSLLDQLEAMNRSIDRSEMQMQTLKVHLVSTEQELHRMSLLASRTQMLEAQLEAMEREHGQLQQVITAAQAQGKTAVQRWKRASRAVNLLQDEVERIERAVTEERELHAKVVARLERGRSSDTRLAGSVARPAAHAHHRHQADDAELARSGVSDFLQGLLQDNMELHAGMTELREMLLKSHEETEQLREQLLLRQTRIRRNPTLAEDLGLEDAQVADDNPNAASYFTAERRRGRPRVSSSRRRSSLYFSDLASIASDMPLPEGSERRARREGAPLAPSSRARQSDTLPSIATPVLTTSHRYSMHSIRSPSTALSSSSFWDDAFSESILESSRPTTPESCHSGMATPVRRPRYNARDALQHSLSLAEASSISAATPVPGARAIPSRDGRIYPSGGIVDDEFQPPATCPHALSILHPTDARMSSSLRQHERPMRGHITFSRETETPVLRRAASHESLLTQAPTTSTRTLRSRPSHLVITGKGVLPAGLYGSAAGSAGIVSSSPVAGSISSTARRRQQQQRHAESGGYESNAYNRSLLQASSSQRSTTTTSTVGSAVAGHLRGALSSSFGSWAWSRRDVKGRPFLGDLRTKRSSLVNALGRVSQSASSSSSSSSTTTTTTTTTNANTASKTPVEVVATEVDEALLQDALLERIH